MKWSVTGGVTLCVLYIFLRYSRHWTEKQTFSYISSRKKISDIRHNSYSFICISLIIIIISIAKKRPVRFLPFLFLFKSLSLFLCMSCVVPQCIIWTTILNRYNKYLYHLWSIIIIIIINNIILYTIFCIRKWTW